MNHSLISLGAINIEARDPVALARFWAAASGAELPTDEGEVVYLPPVGAGGFGMMFMPADEPRPPQQPPPDQPIHLDLTVPWGERAAEVERLLDLGATHCWDVLDEYPHVRWSTLRDPEGYLFCVAEHPPHD